MEDTEKFIQGVKAVYMSQEVKIVINGDLIKLYEIQKGWNKDIGYLLYC